MPPATAVLAVAILAFFAGPARPAPSPAQRCASAKLKAAAKYAASRLRCHERAVLRGVGTEPLCLQKAEDKFAAAFAKADLKGGCFTTGDAAAVRALADSFVEAAVGALEPPVSFAGAVQPVFSARCATLGCHAGAFPAAGLDLTAGSAYANLVDVDSTQVPTRKRVLPGDAGNSYLYQKLVNDSGIIGSPMPLGAFPLPAPELYRIERWIEQGASNN